MSQKKIEDLKKQARIDFKNKSVNDIVSRMPRMLERAKALKSEKSYDESYIVFTKYLSCYDWLKRIKKSDKKYVPLNTKTINAEDVRIVKPCSFVLHVYTLTLTFIPLVRFRLKRRKQSRGYSTK